MPPRLTSLLLVVRPRRSLLLAVHPRRSLQAAVCLVVFVCCFLRWTPAIIDSCATCKPSAWDNTTYETYSYMASHRTPHDLQCSGHLTTPNACVWSQYGLLNLALPGSPLPTSSRSILLTTPRPYKTTRRDDTSILLLARAAIAKPCSTRMPAGANSPIITGYNPPPHRLA